MTQQKDKDKLVLCYVKAPWAYFTTKPLSEQWGDDWDDAPYECNAGEPYDNCFKLAYDGEFDEPCTHHFNSPHSVKRINAGAAPWLVTSKYSSGPIVCINAGSTVEDFISKIRLGGGTVFLPQD